MKRICIFCGSNAGARPEYLDAARNLGSILSVRGIELVYGGAEVGLMGAVAASVMDGGGRVIGVIPESLAARVGNLNISELQIVPTMHERKQRMFDLSDGFIALPGGMGTIEEVFEILTWAQLGFHTKPCGILNVSGYFDSIIDFLAHTVDQKFVKPQHRDMVLVDTDGASLLGRFDDYVAPTVAKWQGLN